MVFLHDGDVLYLVICHRIESCVFSDSGGRPLEFISTTISTWEASIGEKILYQNDFPFTQHLISMIDVLIDILILDSSNTAMLKNQEPPTLKN